MHTGIGPFDIDKDTRFSHAKLEWTKGPYRATLFVNDLDGDGRDELYVAADEQGGGRVDGEVGVDVRLDRLQAQLWYLDIHDLRDRLSRLFASLAVWFARQDAILDNLNGAADSFAILVNGENDSAVLADMSRLMNEVLEAALLPAPGKLKKKRKVAPIPLQSSTPPPS